MRLDMIERLLMEVMRGFGAVPKRGAEIGGILLGSIEIGSADTETGSVIVDDFLQVPIEYRRGPSFLLAEKDVIAFDQALERVTSRAVGFFRSNTRETGGFTAEDVAFCETRFRDPRCIVLFIRPYATKVSTASIIEKDGGHFLEGTPTSEFPFRHREPDGAERGERPRRRHRSSREPVLSTEDGADGAVTSWQANITPITPEVVLLSRSVARWFPAPGWVIGLLALGGLFGLLTSRLLDGSPFDITWLRSNHPPDVSALQLRLTTTSAGDDVTLHWSRETPVIELGQRGQIVIDDGGARKVIDLDKAMLQGGALVYRHASTVVNFRMEVSTGGVASLVETLEWKESR